MKIVQLLSLISVLLFQCNIYAFNFTKKVNDLIGKKEKEKNESTTSSNQQSTLSYPIKYKAKANFSITLPPGWMVYEDKANSFIAQYKNNPGVAVSVVISTYDENFPVKASIKAYSESAKDEQKNGSIEKYEITNLGNAQGVLRIEKMPPDKSDPQRITFQGFKKSGKSIIGVNVVASAPAKDFLKNKITLKNILKSIKFWFIWILKI